MARPLDSVFAEWRRRLQDPVLALAEFNQAIASGQLVIERLEGRRLHVIPRTGTRAVRVDFDSADTTMVTVFEGGAPKPAQFFFVRELAGNAREIKNIFEPDKAMLATAEKRGKGSRKPQHRWGEIRREIVRRVFVNGDLKRPGNVGKLASEIAQWCESKHKKAPDDTELRAAIMEVVAQLERWFT